MNPHPQDIFAERGSQMLGVHSLDRFVIQVPDLPEADRFYSAFGLNAQPDRQSLDLRTFGSDHVWGTVIEGPDKSLHHLSFGIYERDLQPFCRHLAACGIALLQPPAGFSSPGLWFRGHDGVLIELKVAEKCSPSAKACAFHPLTGAAARGTRMGHISAEPIRPRRLSHCLLFTSDVMGAVAFYRDILGLRLSDRAGEVVAFMHSLHGSDHHLMAFAASSGPGFHHASWDIGSIEEIGRGAVQMANAGFTKGWGLGRHVIGSNFFHYVQDPWGGFCEYSCDIDYIPRGHDWRPKNFPMRDALALWGPEPPADFIHNYEIRG